MSIPSSRREFLKFLAGSPLLAGLPTAVHALPDAQTDDLLREAAAALDDPADALSVFDLREVARRALPPAHWGYLESGNDDDATVRANRSAFDRYQLRARRFVDVSGLDTSVELFGRRWPSPIALAPVGSSGAFHADGEVAVARAARERDALQILSTQASNPIERVNEARGEAVWFQLYTTGSRDRARALLRRAEDAGCEVVAVTVDTPAGRNTETQARFARIDGRDCSACHTGQPKPAFAELDMRGIGLTDPTLTWDYVGWLKGATRMKVVIKGLEDGEDARLAVEHGADGIVVSNHGGRAGDLGRGTLEALPEVVAGAAGRVPVLIDGGFRRGTDVFKALALGATAVCIGRAHAYGLAAFGQSGVERVLALLDRELRLAMTQTGVTALGRIGPEALIDTRAGG